VSADEMTIRRATLGDVAAMAAVGVAAWRPAYASVVSAESLAKITVEASADCWRAALCRNDPSVTHLIARRSGRTIGIASVGAARDELPDSGWCELQMMGVHPEAWGTGAGSALHDHCLLRLTARGYRNAYLWLVTANTRARTFYANRGWREDVQRRIDTRLQPHVDELRIQRSLIEAPSVRRPRTYG
jgi:GNAT superfamily N-acetyltransferase